MKLLVFALLLVLVLVVLVTVGESDPDFSLDLSAYAPHNRVHVQVVVARYAEDLSWLHHLPYDDIVVYDKSDDSDDTSHGHPPQTASVYRLPNVGRCDHTYLYHILKRWDHLADVTLFLPGSCPSSPVKWNKLAWVVAQISRTGDSAFPVDYIADRPLHEDMGDFQLNSYQATARTNQSVNPERELQLCEDRPFSEFYKKNFPDLPPVHEVCYKGVFAVSRKHIRQTARSTYARLLSYLDNHSNPEAGHFIERTWLAAFYPIPEHCFVARYWDDVHDVAWLLAWSIGALILIALAQKIS